MSKLYWRRILIASGGILVVVLVIYLTWYKDGKLGTLPATITSPTVLSPIVPPDPSTANTEQDTELENTEFAETVITYAYDHDAMENDMVIQLDSDPRIAGGEISTQVTLRDETFTIFFKEAMDRDSVMEALTRMDPDNTSRVYPKLLHHWTDDRQLHVKVLATETTGWDFYSSRYFLDLGGAKSVSGKELDSVNSRFIATVHPLTQLWRFSMNGQKREKLTDFTEPYNMDPLDELNKNILLSRASHYCECDGVGLMFYSVYEMDQRKLTHYPLDIQLTTNYRGPGSFIADSRGFFFEQPIEGLAYPVSDSSHSFQLDEFVFGASFSKNHESIILALGDSDQTKDFDLMIISMHDNIQQRYPGVIRGHIPEDQAFGTILPITFRDDGTKVYFHAMNKETYQEINFYYEWDGEKVIEWQPPEGVSGGTFFTQSSDHEFRLYANGGLYKNNQYIETPFDTMNYYGGFWIPDTHRYVVVDRVSDKRKMVILDADTLEFTTFAEQLPSEVRLKSISDDGKWVTATLTDEW